MNSDQLFLMGDLLELDPEASDFFLLLGEFARAQDESRKQDLRAKISILQRHHLRVADYIPFDSVIDSTSPLDELLQDSTAPIVDAFLTQDCYLKNPEKLRIRMGLSRERMTQIIDILIRSRIIENSGNGFVRNKKRYFAYKINASAKANATYSRLKTIDSIMNPSKKNDLINTIVFAANEEFAKKVRARVMQFAEQHFYAYDYQESSEVYFANTDLIPLIEDH
ncbi:MAG: hypothetical protein HRU19_13175 [Pseudobacteriovorax sp.]|nr:hypothetical protein [Pseudobacteriovorax sp.]